MKITTRILSLLVVASLGMFFMGCGGGKDDGPSTEEKKLNQLVGSWALTNAFNGTDRTNDFPGLVLSLSGTFSKDGVYDYSFTGTRPNLSPWPGSGKWKFGADPATEIVRDPGTQDETNLTYTVSDTTLEIKFTLADGSAGWKGSREKGVSGEWTFQFTKQ